MFTVLASGGGGIFQSNACSKYKEVYIYINLRVVYLHTSLHTAIIKGADKKKPSCQHTSHRGLIQLACFSIFEGLFFSELRLEYFFEHPLSSQCPFTRSSDGSPVSDIRPVTDQHFVASSEDWCSDVQMFLQICATLVGCTATLPGTTQSPRGPHHTFRPS